MKTFTRSTKSTALFSFILSACFFFMNPATAATAQLPYADEIPAGEPMAIDGVWKNVVLNKNFRFEGGRAINLDPWVAYLFWKVEPDMVAMQNITKPTPGNYIGYNLVDKQSFEITLQANGIFKYKSAIFSSDFIPVQLDYPEMMAEELQNLAGGNYTVATPEAEPEYAPEPAPTESDCIQLVIDPETNEPVCLD